MTARHPLLRMLTLARPLRSRLVLAVLAGAAALSCAVGLLAVSGFLIARAAQHPSVSALTVAVVAVRTFGIGKGVFRYAERLASHDVAFRVLGDVRVDVYHRLQRLAPAGLAEFRSGDLLARLVCDVDAVQDLFIRGVAPPLVAALVGAGAVALVLTVYAPAAGALAAGLLLAGIALPVLVAAVARRSTDALADTRGRLGTEVVDLLAGAPDLAAFGASDLALARVADADAALTAIARHRARADAAAAGIAQVLSGVTLWLVLLLAVAAVSAGGLGPVPLAVVVLTALASFEVVQPLPATATALRAARSSAARVTRVLDAPDPVRDPAETAGVPAGRPAVTLRGARVRYSPDAPWALDGLDLSLPPGRRVAIVGASGAGKSTLASVLLRFRDLDAGVAMIGELPLSAFRAEDVRRLIGGVPQDPHVFATTIRENLRLARPEASDADLVEAARRARLLDWIESLPNGWQTRVGALGTRMSGGERQRLALARAILADFPVLVLDEPTAHLDLDSRHALVTDLLDATTERTLVLITHDLDGLDAMDEVVVLTAGRVAERGRHDELLAADGVYRRMWLASRAA